MIRFDEQIVPNAPLSALSPELIRRYRTERSDLNDEVYLRKLAVIGEDLDGVLRPTVCGVLMGTAHPEQYLPSPACSHEHVQTFQSPVSRAAVTT